MLYKGYKDCMARVLSGKRPGSIIGQVYKCRVIDLSYQLIVFVSTGVYDSCFR